MTSPKNGSYCSFVSLWCILGRLFDCPRAILFENPALIPSQNVKLWRPTFDTTFPNSFDLQIQNPTCRRTNVGEVFILVHVCFKNSTAHTLSHINYSTWRAHKKCLQLRRWFDLQDQESLHKLEPHNFSIACVALKLWRSWMLFNGDLQWGASTVWRDVVVK